MARRYLVFHFDFGNMVAVAGLVLSWSVVRCRWAVPRSGGEIIVLGLQEHPIATVAVAIVSLSSMLARAGLNTFEARRSSERIDGRPLEPRIERQQGLLLLTAYTTTAPPFSRTPGFAVNANANADAFLCKETTASSSRAGGFAASSRFAVTS